MDFYANICTKAVTSSLTYWHDTHVIFFENQQLKLTHTDTPAT
jgi:hypothetical protein